MSFGHAGLPPRFGAGDHFHSMGVRVRCARCKRRRGRSLRQYYRTRTIQTTGPGIGEYYGGSLSASEWGGEGWRFDSSRCGIYSSERADKN